MQNRSKIRHVAKLPFSRGQYTKTCALIVATILLLSLGTAAFSGQTATASSDAARWTKVNIPTKGQAGDWVLADGSDVKHLTMASDGTLYACASGLTYTLYRSEDGGLSWSHIGDVQDAIVGIAISPDDAETIYYATTSAVYRSTDGGENFYPLPAGPGGAGAGNIEITSIDVARLNYNVVAIGTRDTDVAEFGGVYTLDEEAVIPTWTNTGLGGYDVFAVAFSPNYACDGQLVAVITDETDTLVTTKFTGFGWGASTGNARLDRDNSGAHTPVAVASSAAIAFPGDYDSDVTSGSCVLFIAIDTGTGEGDVYKIRGAGAPNSLAATDLNAAADYGLSNADFTGLAVHGDARTASLLAGAADSALTYFSADGGTSWIASRKEPTGESATYVLMPPDFGTNGQAYAATGGDESALSISLDNGETWNQISLIDTDITAIIDLATSPGYSQDKTLFLLTFGGKHSLWRSQDGGDTWARIFAGALSGVDTLKLVELPPQYGGDNQAVFIAGESDGQPAVWKSSDNGRSFKCRFTRDPLKGTPFSIDAWAAVDENTLFIGSYNGSHGLVYRTTNSGFYYAKGVQAGSQSLNSISLSPDYRHDGTILTGNTNGWVYWSNDNGASFEPLPADATSPPLIGSITVAFDPAFASNRTVYAASITADQGIYRFIIGKSTDWESINCTLPAGATLNRLTAADDGTLYAANSDANGGMERCLNPTYALTPTFETVTRGLSYGTTLSGLWQSGHRLWSIDSTNIRLMTFDDTLTSPVTVTSPSNAASGVGSLIDHSIRNVNLNWEPLKGATSYQWQLDYDTDLSSVPSGFEASTEGSSVHLPTLEPATTYYWRVRASAPVLSPWSDKRSFTTSLDTEVVSLRLESPEAGASGVPVRPVFQWTAVAGANAYELVVSSDVSFTNPLIVKTGNNALSITAWLCDLSLDYETTYYWKVRAINASTSSAWSAIGAFTTEPSARPAQPQSSSPEPEPATTLAPLPTNPAPMQLTPPNPTAATSPTAYPGPSSIQSPNMPSWVIYLIGVLLFTIILMLFVILALVLRIKRF